MSSTASPGWRARRAARTWSACARASARASPSGAPSLVLPGVVRIVADAEEPSGGLDVAALARVALMAPQRAHRGVQELVDDRAREMLEGLALAGVEGTE